MAFVYIIQSLRSGRFYIGSAQNLEERFRHHLLGLTPTTKRFGKVELVFHQRYNTLQEARSVERKLKKLKRKDYIAKIVADGYIRMKV